MPCKNKLHGAICSWAPWQLPSVLMRYDGTAQYKSPNELGYSNNLSSSWLSTSGTHRFIYSQNLSLTIVIIELR